MIKAAGNGIAHPALRATHALAQPKPQYPASYVKRERFPLEKQTILRSYPF
ncbi:MAG TPA: hypothetical protein VJR02_18130 [Pyrinomonadaceae bacterium]|nr:hypothetical protein [Pyrinomonadaceae bacterium]